jgi:uncharacterized protein (UPF0548 family)
MLPLVSLSRPSDASLRQFADRQRGANLTYDCVGVTNSADSPPGYVRDHNRVELGRGEAAFSAARDALRNWDQFRLGWVEPFPGDTSIETGEVVVIVARVAFAWVRNACRIVYTVDEPTRFGFAYGTLPGHLESGEERFLIEWDRGDDIVSYDILAFSRPAGWLARLSYPFARSQQRRFGRDSRAAMQRSVARRLAGVDPQAAARSI